LPYCFTFANINAIILKNLKTYKHLFFDLDNTLWDFKANAKAAFYEVFERLDLLGRITDFDTFLRTYEKYNEHLWTEYRKGKVRKDHMRIERIALTFRELGIEDPELTKKVGDLYVATAPQKTNLFPMVHETLQYLSTKYKLYILTNGFAEIQVQKVNNCGLQSYFSKLFMAEMVGYQKPDRRFFEYAIKSVHAHKNECLMVGDDPDADIRGGWNAGIDQVFYNTGKKVCAVKPTWEIDSIDALMEIL
jgi:putative hydrolase of the HAD superfamily